MFVQFTLLMSQYQCVCVLILEFEPPHELYPYGIPEFFEKVSEGTSSKSYEIKFVGINQIFNKISHITLLRSPWWGLDLKMRRYWIKNTSVHNAN